MSDTGPVVLWVFFFQFSILSHACVLIHPVTCTCMFVLYCLCNNTPCFLSFCDKISGAHKAISMLTQSALQAPMVSGLHTFYNTHFTTHLFQSAFMLAVFPGIGYSISHHSAFKKSFPFFSHYCIPVYEPRQANLCLRAFCHDKF